MLLVVLFVFVCEIAGRKRISPESNKIRFDTDLNHLAVDRDGGNVSTLLFLVSIECFVDFSLTSVFNLCKVYVGGRNRLYQLTSDLDIVASVQTGPQNDSIAECASQLADNVNKVLLIDYSAKQLIVCGSIQGKCATRNLQNISLPQGNVVAAIVSSSKSKIYYSNISKANFCSNQSFVYIKMHR